MKKTKSKNNLFPLLITALISLTGGLFIGVFSAEAVGDAYFPQDTDVALDVGTIVIKGSSDADSVITTNTNITVTISAGQTFTLNSSDRLLLSNNGNYGIYCSDTESQLVISSTTAKTVIVTPTSSTCESATNTSGGGSNTTTTSAPITTTTQTLTPTPTTTVSPQSIPTSMPVSTSKPSPSSRGFVSLIAVGLKDGEVISVAGSNDPDIYIVNPHGYKRLFLNPVIFGFYGHLGGFSKVKNTTSIVRDTLVTSGLFRNCEINDPRVYGVETTGEDTGTLHWVNTTGEQAVRDDVDFFKKVFCINTKEFNWYPKGSDYASINQIPDYSRLVNITTQSVSMVTKYKIFGATSLNIRESASTSSVILGKLLFGQVIESLGQNGMWHKIKYQNKDAWVHGNYLQAI